jgi:signal peptidase I
MRAKATMSASRKKSVLRDWIESIIVAFILAMIIRSFIVQAFKIPTGSMRPTLLEGDLILVFGSIIKCRC